MNNFDQSSTGVNIEFDGFFDTWRSQDLFGENFKRLEDGYYMYIDYYNYNEDNYKPIIKEPKDLSKIRKWLIEKYSNYFKDAPNVEIWDAFINILNEEYNDWWKEIFYDHLENMGVDYEMRHELYRTVGYSQGDVAYVVIPVDATVELKRYIDHLFWDAPYYGVLRVNDKEFYLDDYLDDWYEVDEDDIKDVLIKIAKEELDGKERDVLLKFVEENNFKLKYV